ncbi:phage shock protein e-related protein [Anaeramoeba flamelloides]|uniref:Phage shock protein e-related protein n=1 Tax=Anaeramoeba flamelloides TaxID=1746091 RepID=A0ABQ8Z1W3_9EUKA|nr:phage shock protein e-related protein [Anaeramoeba flamelloides]
MLSNLTKLNGISTKFSGILRNFTSKVFIIGGNAGGCSAGAKIRRTSEDVDITILEKSQFMSWANCGLPYHLSGTIPNRDNLLLSTAEKFWEQMRIDVKTGNEAIQVMCDENKIKVYDHHVKKSVIYDYDKLIISPGSYSFAPPIKNIYAPNIFSLKTINDMDKIMFFLSKHSGIKKVVICGAGAIGLESAENFVKLGCEVTIVDMEESILPRALDKDFAQYYQTFLEKKGLKFVMGNAASSFEMGKNGYANKVVLKDGQEIDFDLALVSLGSRPNTKFLANSGLDIDKQGFVNVDEHLQTNYPDVFACGDIVLCEYLLTKNKAPNFLAGPANKMGRIAGYNSVVKKEDRLKFKPVLGTFAVEAFGIGCAKTGLNENECKDNNYSYEVAIGFPLNHVGYMPGAVSVASKLLYEKGTGKILGGQICGQDGVDKRNDVIATAITGGMTVFDFEQIDLTYCPQYGAPKDVVCQMAMIACDSLRGQTKNITYKDFLNKVKELGQNNVQVVDVMTPKEHSFLNFPNSVNIDYENNFREDIHKLDSNKHTFIYCKAGWRAYRAYRILRSNGFKNLYNISGGIRFMTQDKAENCPNEDQNFKFDFN